MQAFKDRIPYSDSLITRLEQALSVCICNAKGRARLSRKPAGVARQFFCSFERTAAAQWQQFAQPDEEKVDWVVLKAIREGASLASVWVGVRLRFDAEAETAYLTSGSVLVLAMQEALYPLIRAEWDHRDLGKSQHAQPHWHVLSALQARHDAFSEVRDFSPLVTASARQRQSLHLAMSSNWPAVAGDTHMHELPHEDNLRNWLCKSVRYSIDQVQYALNKFVARPEAVTQEFRPSPVHISS